MLFHRNPKRTLGVVAGIVVLLATTLVSPLWAAPSKTVEEAAAETRSSGWDGWLEWLMALFDGPQATQAASDDPREDDPDGDGSGDGQNDPTGDGGGLDPSPGLDPSGHHRL